MTGQQAPAVLNGASDGSERGYYVVRVEDRVAHPLAGHEDCRYMSPPQARPHALALVRALMACPAPEIDGHGPWRSAIAGGQRTISLQQHNPTASCSSTSRRHEHPSAGHPWFPDPREPQPQNRRRTDEP